MTLLVYSGTSLSFKIVKHLTPTFVEWQENLNLYNPDKKPIIIFKIKMV